MAYLLPLLVITISVTSSWCQTTTPTPSPIFTTTQKTHRPKPTHNYDDVIATLQNIGQFKTLLDLLTLTGLDTALASLPELTLFAPTDDAFAKLPAGALDSLRNDQGALTALLKYHASATATSLKRANDKVLTSLDQDLPVRLNIYGLLHIWTAEGVNISQKDIHIKNGYVQVVDNVLQTPEGSVMDIIASRPDLSTLNSLLKSSGLDAAIRADHNITVFAPTNDAFSHLKPEIINALQSDSAALKEVLLFHVVSRITLYSLGMKHTLTFPSSDRHRDNVMILENDTGDTYINDAKITTKDLSATNGVVHTIDKVLVPIKVLLALENQGLTVG